MPLFTNCGPQVDASWFCAASCGRTRTATARSPSATKPSVVIRIWSICGAPAARLPRDIQWIAEGVAFTGPDLRQMTAPLVAMERVRDDADPDRRPTSAARDRSNRWRSWPMSGWRPRPGWRRPLRSAGISPPTISSCVPMAQSRWSISIRRRGPRSGHYGAQRSNPAYAHPRGARWTPPSVTGSLR